MEYHWKTNFFRVKDGIKIRNRLFGSDVARDGDGRIQLYSYEGSERCWLPGDYLNVDVWELESLGLENVTQIDNYNEEDECFEDLNGFYLMEFLVPEGEVITAIEISFHRRSIYADGYIWRKGLEHENLWIRLGNDIQDRACQEFDISPEALHWTME